MNSRSGQWLFLAVCAVALASFIWLHALSFRSIEPRQMPTAAVDGKRVWQREGCIECHALFGNGGYNAPDLTHVAASHTESWLTQFLTNPPVMYPHKQKRHPAVNAQEARLLWHYFNFLDTVQVTGWPPQPIGKS